MRYLVFMMISALCVTPMGISAQSSAQVAPQEVPNGGVPPKAEVNAEGQPSELAIMGKKEGNDFLYKLGQSLRIKATGEFLTLIEAELTTSEPSNALRLYLDGVRMSNLPVSVSRVVGEKALTLTFHLVRNPYDDDNRKAWDTLLGQQHGGYVMTVPVALAVGNKLPWTVRTGQPDPSIQLYIVKDAQAKWALGIGLGMFVFAYFFLVKSTAALRDGKDGYYSLGKSQMAFWGLLVVLTFTGLWLLTGTMERIPPQVLILLGISGATGLSAIVIGNSKKDTQIAEHQAEITKLREELQNLETIKLTAAASFPSVSEARLVEIKAKIAEVSLPPASAQSAGFWQDICDDGNGMSFHRVQVVIWTVVLGAVFIRSVANGMSMPEFSETLLALLGISNGTYLGFKIPEKS
jgi:hypothetical protein